MKGPGERGPMPLVCTSGVGANSPGPFAYGYRRSPAGYCPSRLTAVSTRSSVAVNATRTNRSPAAP